MNANRNYNTYSFKSAGSKNKDTVEKENEVAKLPIGIKTPIRLSRGDGLLDMHTDFAKQVSDNLRNLLLTNHGERLGHPDFGADLTPIQFELGSEEGDQKAIERIATSVGKYMPFVSLDGFQTFVDRDVYETIAKIGIRVSYTVPVVDDKLRVLEVMLYMGG